MQEEEENIGKNGKTSEKYKRKKNGNSKGISYKWITTITIWTFILTILLSSVSNSLMNNLHLFTALLVLLVIICMGIFFDIIGIAVAAATEKPFHSMASKKIKGAKEAIKLIRNAEKVSVFCNDVVGDISGIVSGAAGAVIIIRISSINTFVDTIILSLIVTSLISSATVCGKAISKYVSINYSNYIVHKVSIMIYYIKSLKKFLTMKKIK